MTILRLTRMPMYKAWRRIFRLTLQYICYMISADSPPCELAKKHILTTDWHNCAFCCIALPRCKPATANNLIPTAEHAEAVDLWY